MSSILKHISFARDWLNRAEDKMRYGSSLDGEVYLSLAEADIRKAWEASVSQRKKEDGVNSKKSKFLLFLAGVLTLMLVFLGTNYLDSPSNVTESLSLRLADGYRENVSLYQEENEIRLINIDLIIDNSIDRGNLN